MFIKIESNDEEVATNVFECNRYSWLLVSADDDEGKERIGDHLEPYDTGDDDPPEFVRIGISNKPKTSALLLSLFRRESPSSHIVAYNCSAYAMTSEGKTFDKIRG